MNTLPRRILVLGGTGFVGRALAEKVARAGRDIRLSVPTRRLSHAQRLQHLPPVTIVRADVHDERALAQLLPGHDAVVNLVAILHGGASDFDHVHVALPRKLAAACSAAGVQRLVHVSAIGVASGAPSLYLRSKAAGEAALQAAGLSLTLLRPSVIFGAEDRFMNLFASLQAVSPVMPLAGGDAQLQPVWVDDVAEAILRCLDDPHTIGCTYELAGPRVYALAELVRLAGRWAGHERPVVPLPMAVGRLQAMALECLPGQPLMSRDNLRSLAVPNVKAADLPGLAELGIEAAALEAVAPAYLSPDAGRARFNPLRARARRD